MHVLNSIGCVIHNASVIDKNVEAFTIESLFNSLGGLLGALLICHIELNEFNSTARRLDQLFQGAVLLSSSGKDFTDFRHWLGCK